MIKFGGSYSGSGVTPPGSVTRIDTQSLTLNNSSVPNPITTTGIIQFEIQVLRRTRAQMIAEIGAGTLLPGVMYNISNPQLPLDDLYCMALGGDLIDANMAGRIGNDPVEVSWDWQTNSITRIHCPRKNNTTVRWGGGPYNCIEEFDTTSARFRNCYLESCNFAEDGTPNIDGLTVLNDCSFAAIDNANVDSVLVEEFTEVVIEGVNVFMAKFGGRGIFTLIDSFATGLNYDSIQAYINATITFDRPFQAEYYLPYLQDFQKFIPTNGTAGFIADSKSNIISVNLNPAGVIPTYQLSTPSVPMDGQILMIDTTRTITALSFISGSTAAIVDSVSTLVPSTGGLKYRYELSTDTWWQI